MDLLVKLMQRCVGSMVVSFIIFFLSVSFIYAGEIKLMAPVENCVVYSREPSTHIIVKASTKKDLDSLQLLSASKAISSVITRQKNNSGYFVHYAVSLSPGVNVFTLLPGQQKITIDFKQYQALFNADFKDPTVYLYHRHETMQKECLQCHEVESVPEDFFAKPSPYGGESPSCYTCHKSILENTTWQHRPAVNLLCETCHQQAREGGRIAVKHHRDIDKCYTCHTDKLKGLGKDPHMHPFLAFGVCSVCHNPHGGAYRYQLWADGKSEICVGCHVNKEQLLEEDNNGLVVHGIIKGGGCIACHDAHASDYPYMLYAPVNELCASCHNDYIGLHKGHPVGGHPLQGPHNPLKPERGEFNCASCHDPHGSKYQYMLVGDLLGGHVCSQCHN